MERITARYLIETPLDVEEAANVLAGEQSSGTFVAVPGETDELKQRFSARIESITHLKSVNEPGLPGTLSDNGCYHRANIEVSWSIENFGYNLPVMVSTLQGNLYEMNQFTGLKLMDLDVPGSFTRHFPGPRFGIEGSRKLTGVRNRPLTGTLCWVLNSRLTRSCGVWPVSTRSMSTGFKTSSGNRTTRLSGLLKHA